MRGVAAVAFALLLAAAVPLGAQETPRVVRKLDFQGNKAISDEVLASAIATTNSSWFARAFLIRSLGLGEKRYFDEQEFKRDGVRLQVLYRRSGYPHVEIDTVVRRTPDNVYITFRIKEGEPIRVTSLSITGLDTLPEKIRRETLVDPPLQTGDPFNRFIMQATADTITRRLKDRGRPAARVFTSFEANKEAETAAVTFDVVPGKNGVIGTVDVVGANRIVLTQTYRTPRDVRLTARTQFFLGRGTAVRSSLRVRARTRRTSPGRFVSTHHVSSTSLLWRRVARSAKVCQMSA